MIEFIPYGKDNKISKQELMKIMKITSEEDFYSALNKCRKENIVFADVGEGGYWRPDTKKELNDFININVLKLFDKERLILLAYKELDKFI